MIKFSLPYLHSWKRPKATRKGGFFDPGNKELKAAKNWLRLQAEKQGLEAGPNSQWELTIQFVQRDRRSRDIDRMLSFVMDALEGALYNKDHQVTKVLMSKHYDPQGANCVFIQALAV